MVLREKGTETVVGRKHKPRAQCSPGRKKKTGMQWKQNVSLELNAVLGEKGSEMVVGMEHRPSGAQRGPGRRKLLVCGRHEIQAQNSLQAQERKRLRQHCAYLL